MMLAVGLSIAVGLALNKKIPEKTMKWGAAIIFIAFGIFGLYEALLVQAYGVRVSSAF